MAVDGQRPALRSRFLDRLRFEPDEFQLQSFEALERGEHLIVAAPTGAGKTLVANYAVELALSAGRRLFYTTPIKALSNQKFHDLVEVYGWANVGLLTGDNAVNPDAPVVVMTTEVLRNMLYAGHGLESLASVVLDEVHYLQDAYRGPVWEEVIIHLPRRIQLVCLSATVSNAAELEEWIETVRGPTSLVVETTRPVDLENRYLVAERSGGHLHLIRTIKGARANPSGFRFDIDPRQLHQRGGRGHKAKGRAPRKWRTPDRVAVVELLAQRDLLPVIHFIFSRAACDDAAAAVVSAGLVLTNRTEQAEIGSIVSERIEALSELDLDVLGYEQFRAGLLAGVAAHHAGMVPPFKEAVEACFVRGLVKVVYATETLALGINMPARTVVLDKLTKFTGDHHEFLSAGQYTQLTGRAGRRGIDTKGEAVVLWSPFVRFEQVADLALSRQFVLRSSFRPTYNMAANLVRRYDQERARQLLNLSFAQFRADAGIVRSEHKVERLTERHRQVAKRIERDFGPVDELKAALASASAGPAGSGEVGREAIAFDLSHLTPGEIVHVVGPDVTSPLAVVAVAFRKGGRVRVKAADRDGQGYEFGPPELDEPPTVIGQLQLPEPYLPNSASFLHEVGQKLSRTRLVSAKRRQRQSGRTIRSSAEVPTAARKALARLNRVDQDLQMARDAADRRSRSLAGQFDRVIELLQARGHLSLGKDAGHGNNGGHQGRADQDRAVEDSAAQNSAAWDGSDSHGAEWALTPSGQHLARLYHECDLLIVEALDDGLFDGLSGAEVAALASSFVYEERGGAPGHEPWFPSKRLQRRFTRLLGLHLDLAAAESDAALPPTRAPHAGFMAIAHAWASGGDLADVLEAEEVTAGDFVRNAKQLIDLLRQIGLLASDPATGRAARAAAEGVFRDLVAASSIVDTGSRAESVSGHDDDQGGDVER